MRIAMLISTPFPPEEGIGYYTYNLSKKLIESGHEVTVITRGRHRKVEHFYFDRIEVYKPQFFPVYPFHVHIHKLFVEKFFKKLDKGFDVIHIHSPLSPNVSIMENIVVTFHSPLLVATKHMENIDIFSIGAKIMGVTTSNDIENSLLNSAKVVTTVSHAMAREFSRYYGIDISEIVVTENGVNDKKFYPKYSDDGEYILYVGRLSYGKGLFDLIKAIKSIKEIRKLEYPLYLVGRGELENQLRNYIRSQGLNAEIKLIGYVPNSELPMIYQRAVIFVFPSYYEGMPTVVLEAMASGLPVIATDIIAHREIITSYKNGILIPPHSHKELANVLLQLTENRLLRRKLGKNARKTIENRFTWDKISRKFEKIYELATS